MAFGKTFRNNTYRRLIFKAMREHTKKSIRRNLTMNKLFKEENIGFFVN